MNWLAPHPDMCMAPAPSGDGMVKIIRVDGRFRLNRQNRDGMTLIATHDTLAEAKRAAEAL